ncbi:tetratricopeptide repeat protein [Aestuariibacter sp. GS-14]|uniref:tetratricopeptide repeat-containing sulfotransferase family protein n=1 Tax=Aestuariibacter sp. GS-14 TaxID=2590670 RepID=UPI00112DB6CC|nr:sulfotransferase [Aestuariibacter sp. GS-14]TPV59892.1 tetratricopeptide repeat protein [Aestuariibacter sp. GS-14]
MNTPGLQQALAQVHQWLTTGQPQQAEHLLLQLITQYPTNTVVLTHLIGFALNKKQYASAEKYIDTLLAHPEQIIDKQQFLHLIRMFIQHNRFKAGLRLSSNVADNLKGDAEVLAARCHCAIDARALADAQAWLAQSNDVVEGSPYLMHTRANIASMQGDFDSAIRDFHLVLAKEPGNSYAAARIAKCGRVSDETLTALLDALAQGGDDEAKARIHLALGKAYSDQGDYSQAWEHAEKGNQFNKNVAKFDATVFQQQVDHIIEAFTAPRVEAIQSDNTQEHVFIVGMPRSGTTLAEQILSIVDDYYAGGETPALEYALGFTREGGAYTQSLIQGAPIDWTAACNAYNDYFAQFANFSGKLIVNKVPTNFFHVGLIKLMFPKAKIINMQRDPLDVAVSVFFETFSQYFAYTNDLKDIFFVFEQYQRLMTHWSALFKDDVLNVSYQALVSDYQAQVDNIGQFLGRQLPSADEIRGAANHVETPSLWQVRQPINTNAVKKWKRYETQLGEFVKQYS